jgi:hypothetical protein
MYQFLFGNDVNMYFESTHYRSQATRVVSAFQNNFRLGAQAWGIKLTFSTTGRA